MMRLFLSGILGLFVILGTTITSDKAEAAGYMLRFGPTSLGNGGPNPLGMPPGATDIEFSFYTKSGFEANFGLPGILFGYREQRKWGGYVSAGGGAVINANGAGPGVYTAFGYDYGGPTIIGNFEYKQTLGYAEGHVIAPYALRVGVGLWF